MNEEQSELESIMTIDDLFPMLPVLLLALPLVILITKLFPNLFNDNEKYFKDYKEINPGWFGKEI